MAGIGFEIRRMMHKESYLGLLKAYAYSAFISSGPWIISILSIVALSALLNKSLADADLQLFSGTITHVYAFSLVIVGPFQLVLVRFAADRFSDKKTEHIFPSFLLALVVVAVLGGLFGLWFFGFGVPGSLLYQLSAVALMVYVCSIFITSLYLSALRDYVKVVKAFVIGYLLSSILAYFGGTYFGVPVAIFGFSLGHVVLFLLLFSALKSELAYRQRPSKRVVSYFFKFPALLLCGLLYNLGIWIDKFLFWWLSDHHVQVKGFLYSAPQYDIGIYLGLLSIVPGMAVFFLKVETDFAERFKSLFNLLENGGTLSQIIVRRDGIAQSLRDGFATLFKVQGITTILLVVFADKLMGFIQISNVQLGIFRVTLFGAFLLIIFLSLLTILFYFDDRKGALMCTSAFVIANVIGSLATLSDVAWYGYGFGFAAGLGMLIAGWRVNTRLANLEYHIFGS